MGPLPTEQLLTKHNDLGIITINSNAEKKNEDK